MAGEVQSHGTYRSSKSGISSSGVYLGVRPLPRVLNKAADTAGRDREEQRGEVGRQKLPRTDPGRHTRATAEAERRTPEESQGPRQPTERRCLPSLTRWQVDGQGDERQGIWNSGKNILQQPVRAPLRRRERNRTGNTATPSCSRIDAASSCL